MDPIIAALLSFAASTAVKQLIQGREPDRQEWEQVASGLVGILVQHAVRAERSLADIEARLDKLAISSFEEHMAAGRRFLEDLRQPRHADDRREIIHDARSEFVRAVGAGQQLGDANSQAMAEIAIAGCWLWVPSLADAQDALKRAEQLLASALLDIDLWRSFESEELSARAQRKQMSLRDKLTLGLTSVKAQVADYKTQLAGLERLLTSYEQTVSLGIGYGALAETITVPIPPSSEPGGNWHRVDLVVPVTAGRTACALGIEVTLENVQESREPHRSVGAPTSLLSGRTELAQFDARVIVHPPWPEVGLATGLLNSISPLTTGAAVSVARGAPAPRMPITEEEFDEAIKQARHKRVAPPGDQVRVLKADTPLSETFYVVGRATDQAFMDQVALLVRLPHQRPRREPVAAFVVDVPRSGIVIARSKDSITRRWEF